jgi:ribulose-phosphate 3-epimerase
MKVKLSASIICADLADLASQVKQLEEAGVDMLHFDVMDGHFVPNLGLGPVVLQHLRKLTLLPIEAHLMMENPERYIERFVEAGADIVAVHVDTIDDCRETAEQIRGLGASPAIALNPDTPVEQIESFIDLMSQVLVMTVQPGFAGRQLVDGTIGKIARVRATIRKRDLDIDIASDGNVSFENAPLMVSAGANVLICGTSSIFSPDISFSVAVHRLRETTSRFLH